MNLLLQNAKTLIVNKNYKGAIELLESQAYIDQTSIKMLSILYQYYGLIEKETELLMNGIDNLNNDTDLMERLNWCNQTTFNKLIPRSVIQIGANSLIDLNDISRNKLCFITASNDKYFDLLNECLLSIIACKSFSYVPIYVLNIGLSTLNIIAIESLNSRIRVIDPLPILSNIGINFDFKDLFLAGLVSRGFFKELFPGFEICFYLDADAWVQDEAAIAVFIEMALKQGICVPCHPYNNIVSIDSHWVKRGTLTLNQIESVIGFQSLINCCFCANINSNAYSHYRENLFNNAHNLGVKWGIDQEVLLYTAAVYNLSLLPTEYAYEGPFKVNVKRDENQILYTERGEIIKIVHLGGGIKQQDRKWRYFYDIELIGTMNQSENARVSIHFKVPKQINEEHVIHLIDKIK